MYFAEKEWTNYFLPTKTLGFRKQSNGVIPVTYKGCYDSGSTLCMLEPRAGLCPLLPVHTNLYAETCPMYDSFRHFV